MDQVIVFDKSLQQRLNEYLDALSGQEILPASEIKTVWSFYLELSLDPNGWQAVWKIPRLTCEQHNIPFPTIVLVYVESIDCKSLTAVVKILAVQDDISLPDKHMVPLIHLWPTKEQDRTVALNIELTANSLDMFRFFYNNIFMPWDYDENDRSDWVSNHLESRLRLYYDMKNGVIPRATADHIQSLLVEARHIQTTKEHMEAELDDDYFDDIDVHGLQIEDKRLQRLMDLHVRVIEIRGEIEILENPLMRSVVLKRREESSPVKKTTAPTLWLICGGGTVDDCIKFLNQVKMYHPNDTVNFAPNLKAVDSCDTVILSNSKHTITTIGGLEHGGLLKGICDRSETVLSSTKEDVMLDFSGDVVLENLTILTHFSQCGILVRDGKVTLRNCKLVDDGVSSTHQGIIVLNGNELELISCELSGFSTGIVGNSGSKITMDSCKVDGVTFGIKIYDNCAMSLQNCVFSNCREYAFCVEAKELEEQKIGGFEILEGVPRVTLKDLSGENNGKGDVMINHKQSIRPVENIFSFCDSVSEEEMELTNEELNNTVIENKVTLV